MSKLQEAIGGGGHCPRVGQAGVRAPARPRVHAVGLDVRRRWRSGSRKQAQHLPGRDGEHLGTLDELRARARGKALSLTITPHVFRLPERRETTANYEVRSVHWLRLDQLLDPAHRTTMPYQWEGATVHLPCLQLGEIVIWGLTYRMFGELADRLAPGGGWADADGLRR